MSLDQASPRLIQEHIGKERERLRTEHPQWFFDYEDFDPMTSSREVCEELLRTAPTDWARGMISGIMLTRAALAMVTDRGF